MSAMSGPGPMHLEIEAKFRVADHDPIRERLRTLGAQRVGEVMESNHIFDDAGRSLLARQCGLRVRSNRDGATGAVESTLTYKGPPHPGATKQREEIETGVADADTTCRLLRALGFVEVIRFEKRRERWRLGETLIELDTLPKLGTFIEIEAGSVEAVAACQRELRISDADAVGETYVALVAERGDRTGDGFIQARF